MRLNLLICIPFSLTLLVILNGPSKVSASFWDGVPITSQWKTFFQAANGDIKGAKKTQKHFLDQAPVISQLKSFAELVRGDNKAAQKTQKKFLHKTLEPIADNTPIVGHIKGI